MDKKLKPYLVLNIKSTKNNTLTSLCTKKGDVLYWSSAGEVEDELLDGKKFKGHQKRSVQALYAVFRSICDRCISLNIKKLIIRINGYDFSTDILFFVLHEKKIKFISVEDVTPIAHNGCRLPKKRRKKTHIKIVKQTMDDEYDENDNDYGNDYNDNDYGVNYNDNDFNYDNDNDYNYDPEDFI